MRTKKEMLQESIAQLENPKANKTSFNFFVLDRFKEELEKMKKDSESTSNPSTITLGNTSDQS